ncbi:MAG TPA: MliC family protein [Microcoleaceae cyanobacterium]
MQPVQFRLLLASIALTIAPLPAYAQSQTITYRCQDATTFRVTFLEATARVRLQSEILTLPRVPSGSGIRYSDGRTTLSASGKEASIEIAGERAYNRCVAQTSNRPNNRRSRIRALW